MEIITSSLKLSKNSEFLQNTTYQKLKSNKSIRSGSIESSTISNSVYNKLKLRINEFEDLNFPPLQLPTMRKKEKKRPKGRKHEGFLKQEQVSKNFVKFSISDIKKDAISNTTDYLIHSEALGPGKYERVSLNSFPGGTISSVPRFNNGILQVASDFVQSKTKRTSSTVIEKNQELSFYSKEQKTENILTQSKIREFEGNVHKKTKISLDEFKREEKIKKYNQKIYKFEWWLKKEEIQQIKKTWGRLLSAFGLAFGMKMMILSKIARNDRIRKNFILLGIICRFVGRIGIILKNVRWRKLVLTLSVNSKHFRNWLEKRKNNYKTIIKNIVDTAFMGDYITQFMGLFKKNIVFIQNQLRNILRVKRSRNWSLMMLFNKLEKQVSISRSGKKASSNRSSYDINLEIRRFYIKVAIEHVGKMRIYKEELRRYHEMMNKMVDNENFLITIESLEPPKRPIFILYSRTKDIIKRVKTGLGLESPKKYTFLQRQSRVSPIPKN